jgi:hypothetical protein
MDPLDGIWFVCPECGASNGPERTSCVLCGHGLDTAQPEGRIGSPRSPIFFSSHEPINPYKPPATFVSTPLSFQISSLLMVIAVIAVCLGVARANVVLGIVLAVVVVPALVYTMIVTERHKASGRPIAVLDKAATFVNAIAGVVIIEFSALVAFYMTCVPVSFATASVGVGVNAGLIVGLVTGGLAGIGVAASVIYLFLFRKGRKRRLPGKP